MNFNKHLLALLPLVVLMACQGPDLDRLSGNPFSGFKPIVNSVKKNVDPLLGSLQKITTFSEAKKSGQTSNGGYSSLQLGQVLERSVATVDVSTGFSQAIKVAVDTDPSIIAGRENLIVTRSAIGISEAQRDFQVTGSIYGGLEDVSDKQAGIAIVLNANRLIYDGGLLESATASSTFAAEAAEYALVGAMDRKASDLAEIWVDLEHFSSLKEKVDSRLSVLGPLINQLERVANAGIGDVTQVSAAQRTVSAIRVIQTDVSERLAQAQVDFVNAFGQLPTDEGFDFELISGLVPKEITNNMAQNAPAIKSQFAAYMAAEANLASIKAKDKFNVGFETRVTRPFGGSGYDSDESIGFVLNKTLFGGKKLEPEIVQAEARVKSAIANLQAVHREGERQVNAALQNIRSMDKAIQLARDNAKITSDEIVYLRQQLIIGGSTLDSVLSAEARFYDSEAKEINFVAKRRKSELAIISALGLFGSALGLQP